MTDCSPHILSWWKTNELLKEFIDRGYLDIALFDVYNPSDLLCVYSGQTLSANSLHIPPFLILNSVLSCLKQDVLSVRPTGFAPAVISLLSTQAFLSELSASVDARYCTCSARKTPFTTSKTSRCN